MKNKYILKYSPEFYADINNIVIYIKYKLKNNIAAKNLISKVEKDIDKRSKNPESYEKYKTNANNIYYRIYINNYTIFYTVYQNVMEVRRIIYGRRNMEELV